MNGEKPIEPKPEEKLAHESEITKPSSEVSSRELNQLENNAVEAQREEMTNPKKIETLKEDMEREFMSVHDALDTLVAQDSKIADEWVAYLTEAQKENSDPKIHEKAAMEKWLHDHPEFSADDPFGRKRWGENIKGYLHRHLEEIFSDTGPWPSNLFLAHHIIHHFDHDIDFQKEMLELFQEKGLNSEDHPNHQQFILLQDRLLKKEGGKGSGTQPESWYGLERNYGPGEYPGSQK